MKKSLYRINNILVRFRQGDGENRSREEEQIELGYKSSEGKQIGSQSGSLLTFVGVNAEVCSNQINKLVQTVVRPHELYKWRLGMLSDRLSPKEFPMLHLQAKIVVHCCVCN